MSDFRMGVVEAKFADIVWANEPITTRQLVTLCEKELNWKRTTTYTVLKRLCDRGIFVTDNSVVNSLISKEDFYAILDADEGDVIFKSKLLEVLRDWNNDRE